MVYYGMGLKEDALQLLEQAPSHPLITIWKAFIKDDTSILQEAAIASPAFVFPYRTETISALEWAVPKNNSWKFKYYLALNYAAIQRDEETMGLLRPVRYRPDYAPSTYACRHAQNLISNEHGTYRSAGCPKRSRLNDCVLPVKTY
jgi:hypothetical protein